MKRIGHYALALWAAIAFHGPQVWLMYFIFAPATGQGGIADAIINALLLLAWGALHSMLARDFCKRAIARMVGEDFVKVVYGSVAGITQCLLLYLWRPLSGSFWQASGAWQVILTLLFLTVVGATGVTLLSLDYLESLGVRAILRHMHGHPQKPIIFSTRGPYAYCRHPAYFFTILSFWIGPAMNNTKLEFALLGSLYIIIGTYLEDRDSARNLGPDFEAYRREVPILIPRLTPWRPKR